MTEPSKKEMKPIAAATALLLIMVLLLPATAARAQLPFIPPATSKTSEPQNQNQIPEGATAIVTEKGTVVIPAPIEKGNTIILPPAYLIAKNGTIIMLHEGPSPGTAAVGSQVIQLPPIVTTTTTPPETRTTVIHDNNNNNNHDHDHKNRDHDHGPPGHFIGPIKPQPQPHPPSGGSSSGGDGGSSGDGGSNS